MLKISSLHPILQGEGVNSGIPQFLIRLAGCPVHCRWCDSRYTWVGGREYSVESIALAASGFSWVCISGGEPLAQAESLGELIRHPLVGGTHWEVETSGYLSPPSWFERVDTWAIDCKCPSSGVESKAIAEWLLAFQEHRQQHGGDAIKFVVRNEQDLAFALEHRAPFPQNILSPVIWDIQDFMGQVTIGREQSEWNRRVAMFALEKDFRFSLQTHVVLWGMGRRDV